MKKSILVLLTVFSVNVNTIYAQLTPLGSGLSAGVNDFVYALQTDTINDLLYVGGGFTTSGETYSPFISSWDGENWFPLGIGLNGPVRSMCIFEGDLYVGGDFTQAGDTVVNRIAKWDGINWYSVGDGFDDRVQTLCVFNNQLFAGGSFAFSGSTETGLVAKWTGTTWEEVGNGLNGFGTQSSVRTMIVYQNLLYTGGRFPGPTTNTATDSNLAKWNGFSWISVLSGSQDVQNVVYELNTKNGLLWLGQTTTPTNRVYDGVNWIWGEPESPLAFWTMSSTVYTIEFYDEWAIIGGRFAESGTSIEGEFVGATKDQEWYSMDGGVNNSVFVSEVFKDQLYIGGAFTKINNGLVQANYIAGWKSPMTLGFERQNLSCPNSNDGSVVIVPDNGTAPFTFEWNDIATMTDSRSNLSVGTYTCVVTDATGRVATITIAFYASSMDITFNITGTTGSNGTVQAVVTGGTPPYSYNWDNGDSGSSITDLITGNYDVDVTDANGCSVTSQATVDSLISGISSVSGKSDWSIYPNPALSIIHISNERIGKDDYRISIYNATGVRVFNSELNQFDPKSMTIDISNLSAGAYFFLIKEKKGRILYSETLLKQ